MNANTMMAVLVVVLLLLSVVQAVEIAGLSDLSNSASASSDMPVNGDETYEQMMERMHGTPSQPARSSPGSSSSGMVGGC